MSKWLDSNNLFRIGQFKGEELDEVAAEDPGYLRGLLDGDYSLDAEDRAAIEAALGS